jgi:hypothetical protein
MHGKQVSEHLWKGRPTVVQTYIGSSESKKQVSGVVRGRDDGEEAFRHPAISLYALIELSE